MREILDSLAPSQKDSSLTGDLLSCLSYSVATIIIVSEMYVQGSLFTQMYICQFDMTTSLVNNSLSSGDQRANKMGYLFIDNVATA